MLARLERAARSEGLVAAVSEHREQTGEHGLRLEEVFRALRAEPSSNLDPPLEKLARHHDELAEKISDDRLADVFRATAATTIVHHELGAYGALLALAEAVELPVDARRLLERSRAEEAETLERLQGELGRLTSDLGR